MLLIRVPLALLFMKLAVQEESNSLFKLSCLYLSLLKKTLLLLVIGLLLVFSFFSPHLWHHREKVRESCEVNGFLSSWVKNFLEQTSNGNMIPFSN